MMTDRPDAGMLAGRLFSRPGWKTGLQACGQRLQHLSGYSEREPGAELQLALYALSYNIDGPYKIDRPTNGDKKRSCPVARRRLA
jgi:hypothetical protein